MDINDLRGISTLFVLIAFLGICWWAYSPSRKQRFNEDANLPFADEEQHERAQQPSATSDTTGASLTKKRD